MRFLVLLLFLSFVFGRDLILVSVYPFYDVVKDISGRDFRVESLVPPRADYHLYELSPRELVKLQVAKVLFVSGVPLGEWEKKIEKITSAKVFYLSEGIDLLSYGHGELGRDPHFWVSPRSMVKVARNVYASLSSLYGEERFRENYERVRKELLEIDGEYEKTLSSCRIRKFGVLHPALGYVARDYGLEQVILREEHGHGDISPKELRRLLRKIKRGEIEVIFVPKGTHSELAHLLAERGVRVYEINVKFIPEGGETYYEIARENLKVLKEALQCG